MDGAMSASPGVEAGRVWSAGQVVWVKLGSCWWPGSVADVASLPPDLLRSVRKPPLAIVHFFQEDYFEFVRNESAIFPYNCSRKEEFIKKGLDMYRGKHSQNLDKFPEDVIRAEELTGGDLEILTRPQYQQEKKESYAGLFGDASRQSGRARGRVSKPRGSVSSPPTPRSTHNKKSRATSGNYKAHILVQGSPAPTDSTATPAASSPTTPAPASATPGLYTCHACAFSSSRLNVMILHTKSHSTDVPQAHETSSQARKQSPKKPTKQQTAGKKRVAQRAPVPPTKKLKAHNTVEIKNTLLADWEDGDESPPAALSPPPPASSPPSAPSPPPAPPLSPAPSKPTVPPLTPHHSCFDFCDEDESPAPPRTRAPAPFFAPIAAAPSPAEPDMEREVAELLQQTAPPRLPTEPVFKTKTFFRSRQSRGQDAIVKYVAEQLSAERAASESPPHESDQPAAERPHTLHDTPADLHNSPRSPCHDDNLDSDKTTDCAEDYGFHKDSIINKDIFASKTQDSDAHGQSFDSTKGMADVETNTSNKDESDANVQRVKSEKNSLMNIYVENEEHVADSVTAPLDIDNSQECENNRVVMSETEQFFRERDNGHLKNDTDEHNKKEIEIGNSENNYQKTNGDSEKKNCDENINICIEDIKINKINDNDKEKESKDMDKIYDIQMSRIMRKKGVGENDEDIWVDEPNLMTKIQPLETDKTDVEQHEVHGGYIEKKHTDAKIHPDNICIETQSNTENTQILTQSLSDSIKTHSDMNKETLFNSDNLQTDKREITEEKEVEPTLNKTKIHTNPPSKLLNILAQSHYDDPKKDVSNKVTEKQQLEPALHATKFNTPLPSKLLNILQRVTTSSPTRPRNIIIRRTAAANGALPQSDNIVLARSASVGGVASYTIRPARTSQPILIHKQKKVSTALRGASAPSQLCAPGPSQPSTPAPSQPSAPAPSQPSAPASSQPSPTPSQLSAPASSQLSAPAPSQLSAPASSQPSEPASSQLSPTPSQLSAPASSQLSAPAPSQPPTPASAPATAPSPPCAPTPILTDDTLFDINSMPIVLSEDLAAETEITPAVTLPALPPSKPSPPVALAHRSLVSTKPVFTAKPAMRKLTTASLLDKSPAPNILSKSKVKPSKPMLVVDELTGRRKIIVPDSEPAPLRADKTAAQPDPTPRATVMIITDASGAQSRIVLSAQHEKLLFPDKTISPVRKPQPRIISKTKNTLKNAIITSKGQLLVSDSTPKRALAAAPPARVAPPARAPASASPARGAAAALPARAPAAASLTRAILLPSPARAALPAARATFSSARATLPSARATLQPTRATVPSARTAVPSARTLLPTTRATAPAPSTRIIRAAVPSTSAPREKLILFQNKSGGVVELTQAQFEQLQRTGRVVHKTTRLSPRPTVAAHKPAPVIISPAAPSAATPVSAAAGATSAPDADPAPVEARDAAPLSEPDPRAHASELDNLEELLPSTAIARRAGESATPSPAAPAPPAAPAVETQLLAVPGENFGGPANTFYLCVEENGTLTPVDNRPLVLDDNQLVPMSERRDILAAALANTDVFPADSLPPPPPPPDFRDLNVDVSAHSRVSETSVMLNQPIMTPLEVPSARAAPAPPPPSLRRVIGAVPPAQELPITVTDPRIAPPPAPPISMPLLTDDDVSHPVL